MADKPPRIALLIDADNAPATRIGFILNELSTFGETSIRRAYGNWKNTRLVTLLRAAVDSAKSESGWARVGAVGQQIGNQASFNARNDGYATLSKLLKATELFQLDKEVTSEVAVRDLRNAKPAKL